MAQLHQLEVIVESFKLIFIFGFVFSIAQMIMTHTMKMKGGLFENESKAAFYAQKKRLIIGLGLLCIGFVMILIVLNYFRMWPDHAPSFSAIASDPRLMREAMNKIFDAFKLLVIFCFVGFMVKLILNYREKLGKIKKDAQEKIDKSEQIDMEGKNHGGKNYTEN